MKLLLLRRERFIEFLKIGRRRSGFRRNIDIHFLAINLFVKKC
jgi:hypothetical protein